MVSLCRTLAALLSATSCRSRLSRVNRLVVTPPFPADEFADRTLPSDFGGVSVAILSSPSVLLRPSDASTKTSSNDVSGVNSSGTGFEDRKDHVSISCSLSLRTMFSGRVSRTVGGRV